MLGAKLKILVVDDDELVQATVAHVLEENGHRVTTASTFEAARTAMKDGEFNVIVSDWDLDGASGLELCRALRSMDCPAYVYFILLTSRSESCDRVEAIDGGVDEFISKPFDAAELCARIRSASRILSLETREVTIFALAKLAESRDPETGAHLERVQAYCAALSRRLRERSTFGGAIDGDFIRLIRETSPLHDIGKVGIPDGVLLKPGRLTPAEFEIMKTHTTLGAQTLNAALARFPAATFLRMARDIAVAHHERWDGRGYPEGLAGEDIPLAARVVSVADVYDALTSKRIYKSAYTHEVARSIILEETGKQFDPRVVETFRKFESDFIAIHDRLADDATTAMPHKSLAA